MSKNISEIHRKLEEMGVRHSNLGYTFLLKAVQIVLDNKDSSINLTDVYSIIAKQYGRSGCSIERAIRYSISSTGLTSKEFIMKVADDVSCSDFQNDRVINLNLLAKYNYDAYC